MSRVALGLLLAGAAGAMALVTTTAVSAGLWHLTGGQWRQASPRQRARQLALWRLSPALAAGVLALATFTAFIWFEPIGAGETPGAVLPLLCLAAIASVAAGVWRLALAIRQTTRAVRAWRPHHTGRARRLPIFAVDTAFPVVAVVGIFKPRLLVARRVVAACDRAELDAMVAHEEAHVSARDNVTRLLFAAAPVVPFTARTSRAIERAWVRAAEEAADDAARIEGRSPLALASALTKMARLTTGEAPLAHASAISSGSGIEGRVRRLLEPVPEQPATRRCGTCRLVVVVAATIALLPGAANGLYDLAEYCVQHLP